LIKEIVKRGGQRVTFNQEKITNALWKAFKATGERNRDIAVQVSDKITENLIREYTEERPPSIEEVQDIVEGTLMAENHTKTAKAYILYRQYRSQLRSEKKIILEKTSIDEVDKRFSLNSLRVLKSRYLRKSEDGKLIENPKQLFTRVAVHSFLPNLFYHPDLYDIECKQEKHTCSILDEAENDNKFSIGKYKLNRYHLEALKRMYDTFNSEGKMKLDWSGFLALIKTSHFSDMEKDIDEFYDAMTTRRFMPNTPAVANFGSLLGMGSACFVIDVEDTMEGIMDALKAAAIIFKSGGGVGYNFSKLRPSGDFVRTTCGVASGPLTFMKMFDVMTEVVKQGGIRRGANMGIMNINHPDIEKFITAKKGNQAMRNFNISVMIMPDFWDYYERDEAYPLRSPRTGDVVRKVNPKVLFDMIVYQAWESAEPGVLFHSNINKYNPFLKCLGPIQCTNPCGEVVLYPNESCNLGSVNVLRFVKEDDRGKVYFDWEGLAATIRTATKFLDNVIDVNKFPLPAIEKMSKKTRKIGLGVMGIGDLLYELKLRYDSEEGRAFMERIMEFINYHSKLESIELAKNRGSFPLYKESFYPEGKMPFSGFYDRTTWKQDWDSISEGARTHGIRNGFTTVIAPTGSISMITGCSSGMEPVYALVFEKHVKVGSFYYTDPVFEKAMRALGIYDESLMRDVCDHGGKIQTIRYIPQSIKDIFITAVDIPPADHIRALAAFQRWTDSSISKTNNFPANATVDDMKECYELAYKLGCKGVTVYRDGSIQGQVLVAPKKKKLDDRDPNYKQKTTTSTVNPDNQKSSLPVPKPIPVEIKKDGGVSLPKSLEPPSSLPSGKAAYKDCPVCSTKLAKIEGCVTCQSCGWGLCA
jgi:ribonucleoside-diphosphate reductase alpha chain